jgi:hypothetical protein
VSKKALTYADADKVTDEVSRPREVWPMLASCVAAHERSSLIVSGGLGVQRTLFDVLFLCLSMAVPNGSPAFLVLGDKDSRSVHEGVHGFFGGEGAALAGRRQCVLTWIRVPRRSPSLGRPPFSCI